MPFPKIQIFRYLKKLLFIVLRGCATRQEQMLCIDSISTQFAILPPPTADRR